MILDRDVWQAAVLLVKCYGDDAMLKVARRTDQMLDEGDILGAERWHRAFFPAPVWRRAWRPRIVLVRTAAH
jgi:hypothetical protein